MSEPVCQVRDVCAGSGVERGEQVHDERIAAAPTVLQDPQNREMKLIFARYVPVLLITGTSASQAVELISTR
jgi:hypothetical protein